jgi:hypothetical protein
MSDIALYYYIDEQGVVSGPVPYSELQALLKRTLIKPTSLICKVGDTEWAPFYPTPDNPGIPVETSSITPNPKQFPLWLGILLGLAVAGIFLNALLQFLQIPRENPPTLWRYKTIAIPAKYGSDTSTREIGSDMPELISLGSQGWEVAGIWLEQETVYPNFGKSDYVTGIQPNMRPSRLVILLKQPYNPISP